MDVGTLVKKGSNVLVSTWDEILVDILQRRSTYATKFGSSHQNEPPGFPVMWLVCRSITGGDVVATAVLRIFIHGQVPVYLMAAKSKVVL